ncbi:MAG: N-6 DNA methylase [Spirochaetaceae bacterium]|nr:N-6 DNA methylase [Spirochaetaceae bacterium]
MSDLAGPLRDVLEGTGYLTNGVPAAPSVALTSDGDRTRLPSFEPDAWWRSNSDPDPWAGSADLKVYFKFVEEPDAVPLAEWQQEVWNQGFCPLLWLVSPERIEIYNGFGRPQGPNHAKRNRLGTFRLVDHELERLDRLAGRLAMETGQFWRQQPRVNRTTSVDRQLLRDLAALKGDLEDSGLAVDQAQALIGRSIFTQYLIDRRIVKPARLEQISGHRDLPGVLDDRHATTRLFHWLRNTFNGDMFPPTEESVPSPEYLRRVRDFLTATDPESGQHSLFPYRFEVIPVGLISAIYEQFVHSESPKPGPDRAARQADVYYTPLTAVSLVLDEVCAGLTGNESVLDLTCGSGVFLVEALRRLVYLKSDGSVPTRATIRKTLYEQIYGVDVSPEAVSIAAFSLYLTALELDPDPHAAHDVRFQPLVDHTLRVSDAFDVDWGTKKFDLIVGNPPMSFRGRAGTSARRMRNAGAPRSPRGESIDFITHAIKFAHDRTKFGVILSATPFFSRSGTGMAAVRSVVETVAPVTLVNLSELSNWLFQRARFPAMVLFARHREQAADRMTLVRARWSPAGERGHTVEIAPSDITTLPLASWKRNPGLFKAAFLGRRHDLLLLDDLCDRFEPLVDRLKTLGTDLKTGLIIGNRSSDAGFLRGLPFADRKAISHFKILDNLPRFDHDFAEGPRHAEIYRAPLLLIKEFVLREIPRPVVAVAMHDIVYTDAYFGASFSIERSDTAYLAAGILSSALASWYFLMTGSAFGIWLRRVKRADIAPLPTPDLVQSINSEPGRRVVRLVRAFHERAPGDHDWNSLDDAVFDLYGLDDEERIVVRDGLFQTSWQWQKGKLISVEPADEADMKAYAEAFLVTMDTWLSASDRRRMRAEIYRLPDDAPLRVIRFVLEDVPGPSEEVVAITPDGTLRTVLARIGERTRVQITDELFGLRDLRVHAVDEVSIIKPAARRNWLRVQALEDADQVVQDSVDGVSPA